MGATLCVKPGQRFYDLGSGTGKVVILAGLLGLDATGIELIEENWKASCEALDRLKNQLDMDCSKRIRFLHANVLDADFADADIIFSSNLVWPDELWTEVSHKALLMQKGSLIVTHKALNGPAFELITCMQLATNWDLKSAYLLYV